MTPVTAGFPAGKRPDRDTVHPWFKKPLEAAKPTASLCLETSLLEPDFDDNTFPLFGASPPPRGMASAAAPVNLSTRLTSTSPQGPQPSTLTKALKRSDSQENKTMDRATIDTTRLAPHMVAESSNDFSRFENGARPISMKGVSNEKRRESIAQSLGAGMSWGGISVGSFIRDE